MTEITGAYVLVPTTEIDDPENAMRTSKDDEKFQDLIDSIEKVGLIQPLTVTKKSGRYIVVAGHRRLQACRTIGMETIPCVITSNESGKIEAIKLHENIIREDINIIDESKYFAQLLDKLKVTPEELANIIHRSKAYVQKRLNIVDFYHELIALLQDGSIAYAQAYWLNEIENETIRRTYIKYTIQNGATGAQVRKWVEDLNATEEQDDATPDPSEEGARIIHRPEANVQCEVCQEHMKYTETRMVRICGGCLTKADLK